MRGNYFGRVLNSLNTECTRKNFELDFVTLKSYEYWIRMMRICKSYPDANDCIAIISKERASRVIKICKHIFATLGLQAFPCGKSGARSLIIWAFPHIHVRSGYILGAIRGASHLDLPPRTKPCSRKHQEITARKSSPQGVTIPNANAAGYFFWIY